MKKSKLYTLWMTLMIALFIISFSIAAPIIIRPFYYWQINVLDIVKTSGYDLETIKIAYNEMMDFCLGLSNTFSCGALEFTEEGMLHFVDVRNLFILDIVVMVFSGINIIIYLLLNKLKGLRLMRLANHSAGCNAAKGLATFFICLALLALPDFDYFFTLFHKIFFPGKDNWLFDPRYDQIINILPEQFFANCALCIVIILVTICTVLIIKDYSGKDNSNVQSN